MHAVGKNWPNIFVSPGRSYECEGHAPNWVAARGARACMPRASRGDLRRQQPFRIAHTSFTPRRFVSESGARALAALVPTGTRQTEMRSRTIAGLRVSGYHLGTPSSLT